MKKENIDLAKELCDDYDRIHYKLETLENEKQRVISTGAPFGNIYLFQSCEPFTISPGYYISILDIIIGDYEGEQEKLLTQINEC